MSAAASAVQYVLPGTERPITVTLRCIPQGHGKNEYGHVWTSSEEGALCQCGKRQW